MIRQAKMRWQFPLLAALLAGLLGPAVAGLAQAQPAASSNDPAYLGFFTPPQTQGEIKVELHVDPRATNKVTVMSFGAPFPPGCVREVGQIYLKDSRGKELPLHVKPLAVWPAPVPGHGSLRAVLVQFQDYIASDVPRTYTLGWGRPRQESEPRGWPVREGWLPAQTKDYPPGKVLDPPVYVTLPAEWLERCLLKGPMLPAERRQALGFYDQAMRLSFATAANRLDPKVDPKHRLDVAKEHEAWLYDRSMSFFVTYVRLGGLEPLVEAHRAAQYYASQMLPDGKFALLGEKNGADIKYGYQECLLLDYWLTGDEQMPEASRRVLKVLDTWDPVYAPERSFWTERNLGLGLLNAVAAYEMWGDQRLLARARAIFEAAVAMQNAPPAGAPNEGCMVHTGRQHGEKVEGWICSVWMSSLMVDAMLRYYLVTADPRAPASIEKLADFVVKTGTYRLRPHANEPSDLTFPYYLVSSQTRAQVEADPWTDRQHALDSALILAAADYFSRQAGRPKPEYRRLLQELLATARWNFDKHYRPDAPAKDAAPAFPLAPARKFNWWFRTTASLDWFLSRP
jgi:hypothetical protein